MQAEAMAAWQTDSPPLPVWGELRRFDQYPRASLRSVLEGNRTAQVKNPAPFPLLTEKQSAASLPREGESAARLLLVCTISSGALVTSKHILIHMMKLCGKLLMKQGLC